VKSYKKNWVKYIGLFVICLLVRLIPFRAPNIEPILATQMPFSRIYGKIAGFSFAFFSIILYDILTGKVGSWTFITAVIYGFLGLWAIKYFKNKKNSKWDYAKFAIMGTILFDISTGFLIGPLFFNQPLMGAIIGQIPFTGLHLLGNVSFALLLSPVIYTYTIKNQKTKNTSIITIFNTQKI
jgi:energy-coupling factor transport system substrate-specific component